VRKVTQISIFIFFSIAISFSQSKVESLAANYDKCILLGDTLCLSQFINTIKEAETDSLEVLDLLGFGSRVESQIGFEQLSKVYDLAMSKAKEIRNDKLISDVLERMASIELYTGNIDKAQSIYFEALSKAIESKDEYSISKSKINLGHVYSKKGEIDTSAYYYREGILDLENQNNKSKIGYPYMFLGILYGVNGQRTKSINNFRKSYNYFVEAKDTSMSATVSVNLANTFLSLEKLDSAEHYLNYAIPQFKDLNDTRSLINAETQLGRLYVYQSQWERSLIAIKSATQKAIEMNLKPQLLYNYRLLSEIYLAQDNHDEALNNIFLALDLSKETGINNEYPQILEHISDIYLDKKNYEQAYKYERKSNHIADSIFSEKKKLKVEELEAKFESEKKEKEIANLNAESIKNRLKRIQLLWMVSIAIISLLSFIGFMMFKQKKNKQLLIKERDLEMGQRRTVELKNKLLTNELELKNKELLSSTFLISKKNAFLESLKQKVENKDDKLQRLINNELESESEWKNFINAFNNAHSNFVKNLYDKHKSLSVTEVRLSCLMKMNLSSKEIASVLNISYEGVKKAKYRLKKKLKVQEGDDLLSYIQNV